MSADLVDETGFALRRASEAHEPNDLDWQPLDVVMRTTLSIDFNAETFQHRHFTRQIKLPPWTDIGPEVARW